jgi:hypothetical protein
MNRKAFAIAAHPDDIEFMMAGTLLLLKRAGYEIHYMNVANGSCGTAALPKEQIIDIRRRGWKLLNLQVPVFMKALLMISRYFMNRKLWRV